MSTYRPCSSSPKLSPASSSNLAANNPLDLERFELVSISTGGGFALAVAAQAPERVSGAVICCSMTDMRHEPARSLMSRPHDHAVWDAPDRDRALAAAIASHGIDGSKIIESAEGPPLAPSDLAMLNSPWGRHFMAAMPTMFAHGVQGYTDDRLADNHGWTAFNVADIVCPVIVLHGTADVMVDPLNARRTAAIVPGARLRLIEGLGHFSIERPHRSSRPRGAESSHLTTPLTNTQRRSIDNARGRQPEYSTSPAARGQLVTPGGGLHPIGLGRGWLLSVAALSSGAGVLHIADFCVLARSLFTVNHAGPVCRRRAILNCCRREGVSGGGWLPTIVYMRAVGGVRLRG